MGIRARARVFGIIVLAVTAGGCGGPAGNVHSGQTGVYLELRYRPASSDASSVPPVVVMPRLYLRPNGPKGMLREFYPRTPIVVTENPADEEFWEIAYPMPAAATEGGPRAQFEYGYVIGDRRRCEAERETHAKSGIRTVACIGPHYFKRTGPSGSGPHDM